MLTKYGVGPFTPKIIIQKFHYLYFWWVFVVRGARPGKNVQLTENEIRGLCLKSREIFLSQPILLELEAPLKICGKCLLKYHSKDPFKVSLFLYQC